MWMGCNLSEASIKKDLEALKQQILVKTIDRLTSFQFETAEERYNKIIHDKNYTQRLPLKELASFIGITPPAPHRPVFRKNRDRPKSIFRCCKTPRLFRHL